MWLSVNPRVSVLMTAYRAEDHIESAIASVLGQTLQDLELVIVIDGPSPATVEIVDEAARGDERVVAVPSPRVGRSGALNIGLDHCTSPLVAIMDADDLSLPTRLERQADVLEQASPRAAVLGTIAVPVAEMSAHAREAPPASTSPDVTDVTHLLRRRNPLVHSSVVLRRMWVDRIGGYDVGRTSNVDYDLYVRLARSGASLLRLEEPLLCKRHHPGQAFLNAPRVRYRLASLNVQMDALSAVEGPISDYGYLLLRLAYGAVPTRARRRARTRSSH